MIDTIFANEPQLLNTLEERSKAIGFTMPSDKHIGALLKTLVSSKSGGHFLELGTGIGLSLSWVLDGIDTMSKVISLDNDEDLVDIAREYFGTNNQLELIAVDGEKWLENYDGPNFDLIFADTWPGKYNHLDETLSLLNSGGFYVIDDMIERPNWPEGHKEKVDHLLATLDARKDLVISKMHWSTGILVATKVAI